MATRQQPLPDWARKFRPPVDRGSLGLGDAEANRQSIYFGLVATLIVNVLLFFAPGQLLNPNLSVLPSTSEDDIIELLEEPEEPEPPAEENVLLPVPEEQAPRVVQTNPDTPDREAPDTPNESNRNQRAANEITPEGLSPDHSPAREGEELPTERILSAEAFETPPPTPPPMPEGDPVPAVELSQPTARDPLPGSTDEQGEAPDGVGTARAPETEEPEAVDERVEGQEEESPDLGVAAQPRPQGSSRTAPPAPRPRVALPNPGPAQRQLLGVTDTGSIEADARFSDYGEYLTRLVDAVSQRWNTLCFSRAYSESGTHVVIHFTLAKDGRVHLMQTLARSSQSVGEYLCRTAIEQCQPFGLWTEEMVARLGEEEPITLTFYYR